MPDAAPQPKSLRPDDVQRWLRTEPSLEQLAAVFPAEWRAVQAELAELGASPDAQALERYLTALAEPSVPRPGARPSGRDGPKAQLSAQVQRHIAAVAIRQARLSSATGVTEGRVRFNLLNGWIAQRLLFERDLVRKPVSMAAFRLLWPLLWQRSYLMPLVERQGIYCFYSRALVRGLAELIDGRPCLEIGAGDGTLARFLAAEGVDVVATDDFSWGQHVTYPKDVRQTPAREALRTFRREVVLCSWPPPGNPFERLVFQARQVRRYVVIGSRERAAASNWQAYEEQEAFERREEPRLSRLVLPPEVAPVVHVFDRREQHGPPPRTEE